MVRKNVGYYRYETKKELKMLNELYKVLRLYTNFLQPVMKLVKKTRVGSKVIKRHPWDAPLPCLLFHIVFLIIFVNTLYAFFISLYKGIQNNYLSAPARRQAGLPAGRRGQAGIQSQRRRQKHEIKEHFFFFSFSFLCNG